MEQEILFKICNMCLRARPAPQSLSFSCEGKHSFCFSCFPHLLQHLLLQKGFQKSFFHSPKAVLPCILCKSGQITPNFDDFRKQYSQPQDLSKSSSFSKSCSGCKVPQVSEFCSDCRVSLCEDCAKANHREHSRVNLRRSYDILREIRMRDFTAAFQEFKRNALRSFLELSQETTQDLEREIHALIDSLNALKEKNRKKCYEEMKRIQFLFDLVDEALVSLKMQLQPENIELLSPNKAAVLAEIFQDYRLENLEIKPFTMDFSEMKMLSEMKKNLKKIKLPDLFESVGEEGGITVPKKVSLRTMGKVTWFSILRRKFRKSSRRSRLKKLRGILNHGKSVLWN